MATYAFETIGAAEALAFGSADSLTTPAGSSARTTTVLYLEDGTFSVTMGARTVVFGVYFPATLSRLVFPDGSKLFVGGAGADTRDEGVVPSTGAMYGGDGADSLTGSPGEWFVQGNQGDDRIVVRVTSANTVYGGQGADNIAAIGGAVSARQFMQGNKGDDTLQGGDGADTLIGGQGNDLIHGTFGQDFINGNLGDDVITGAGQLFGEGGADRLTILSGAPGAASGGDDNDTLTGGGGADTLFGGEGHDSLDGAAGDNRLDGGGGNDYVNARQHTGANSLTGGDGDDTVLGGFGADTVSGGLGADQLVDVGGGGNVLDAGAGNDRLAIAGGGGQAFCGDGDDTLDAILGVGYAIDGGAGNDLIRGTGQADTILGGTGADTIDDGGGTDVLFGGAGADRFQFFSGGMTAPTSRISDWSAEDRLQFHTNFAQQTPLYEEQTAADLAAATALATDRLTANDNAIVSIQVGADVIVFSGLAFGSGVHKAVMLVGRSLADISADNFV